MKGTCLMVRAVAPSIPAERLSARVESHVASCLACQAELVRYARLRRQLAALADVAEVAPPGLAAAANDAVGIGVVPPVRANSFHPARAIAAASAVAVAAAGTVVVAWLRHVRAATQM